MKYIILLLLLPSAIFGVSCDESGAEVTLDNPLQGFIGTNSDYIVRRVNKSSFPWRVPSLSMERHDDLCRHFIKAREAVANFDRIKHSQSGGTVLLRIWLYTTDDEKQLIWGQLQAINDLDKKVIYSSDPIVRAYD